MESPVAQRETESGRDQRQRRRVRKIRRDPEPEEDEESQGSDENAQSDQEAEEEAEATFSKGEGDTPKPEKPGNFERRKSSSEDWAREHRFLNFKDLSKLPRIELNSRGHFTSTHFKYDKPISNFRVRIQLLKYQSLSQQQKNWSGDLLVVDERIFSWQEKVFSKTEAEFYSDKKNLVTELDESYQHEIGANPGAIGSHLYSLVDSEIKLFSGDENLATVRHCPVNHSSGAQGSRTLRSTGSISVGRESLSISASSTNLKPINSEGESVDEGGDLSLSEGEAEGGKKRSRRKKTLSLGRMTSDRKWLVRLKERKEELLETRRKKALKKSSSKDGEEDEDEEVGPRPEGHPDDDKRRRRSKSFVISSVPTRRSGRRWGSRGKVQRNSPRFPAENSMKIFARIPHMPRTKRDLTVCSVKIVPSYGLIVLKPSFGFRIIEAKRNHVYRLSWELWPSGNEPGRILKDLPQQIRGRLRGSDKKGTELGGGGGGIGVFDMVATGEIRLFVMGEIISAEGFEEGPLSVQYFLDTKGWRNEDSSILHGATHSCLMNDNDRAYFSHELSFHLTFSMDSLPTHADTYPRPVMYLMVVSSSDPMRIRHIGYAYLTLPSRPGLYMLKVNTWKPRARTIKDQFADIFLGAGPSLQDIRFVHLPTAIEECKRRTNKIGMTTDPSGSLTLRLNVVHQVSSASINNQRNTLQLLEKMSSATILKSVQTVIESYQRARTRASDVSKGLENRDI